MTRAEAASKHRTLKEEKDNLKKFFREQNQQLKEGTAHKATTLIFPALAHESRKVDWSFQQYFNGFIVKFGNELLLVDPGADFYTRLTLAGLDINNTRGIFLSHKHIDHCAGLPLLLDMLIKLNRPVDLIIPRDAFSETLTKYLRQEIRHGKHQINLILLAPNQLNISSQIKWRVLKGLQITRLYHSAAQTYGFGLEVGDEHLVYISDTGYAKAVETTQGVFPANEASGDFKRIVSKHTGLRNFAQTATVAVVNINDLFYNRHALTHLIGWDLLDMFEGSPLHSLILQHLSPYNARGKDSSQSFISFFKGERYKCIVPRETLRISL